MNTAAQILAARQFDGIKERLGTLEELVGAAEHRIEGVASDGKYRGNLLAERLDALAARVDELRELIRPHLEGGPDEHERREGARRGLPYSCQKCGHESRRIRARDAGEAPYPFVCANCGAPDRRHPSRRSGDGLPPDTDVVFGDVS